MDKRFLMILAAVVVVFGGLIALNKSNQATTTDAKPTNHVAGKLDSKVTFVEYGDFQCNACKSYSEVFGEAKKKYEGTVKFQFRHMPLSQIHPNAFAGARAAEAAGKQNKFWEMHDLLYSQQDPTAQSGWVASQSVLTDYFVNFAKQIGLDVEKFKKDYASSEVNNSINADIKEFEKTGQQKATPAFFINGKSVSLDKLLDKDNSPSIDAFSKVIDDELAKVN